MSTSSGGGGCCCCGAQSASSRCCIDYSRLTELQPSVAAAERQRSSSVELRSASSVPRPRVDVQSSPRSTIYHDDDDDTSVFDDSGTSNDCRPTVLRLTTFKPSLQPPPPRRSRCETITEDGGFPGPLADQQLHLQAAAQDADSTRSSDVDCTTSKQLSVTTTTTSTSSSVSVVSTVAPSAVLDQHVRLQPDLLPLTSTLSTSALVTASAAHEDSSIASAVIYGGPTDDAP